MRCQSPSCTGTVATFGVSHTSEDVENCGKTRSSYGPPTGPYITIVMLPCSLVKAYWILLDPVMCPCQGLLGFHHIPTKSWCCPDKGYSIVPGATPPAIPVGYVNCRTKGGDSGAVWSREIAAVPNSRIQFRGVRMLQGSSATSA